jgi:hypothetical protein
LFLFLLVAAKEKEIGNEQFVFLNLKFMSTTSFTTFKLTITAAQLQTANSIPINIPQLPAPGAGYAWSVAMAELRFFAGSTAFSSTTLFIITDTAAIEQMVSGEILNSYADSFSKFIATGSSDTAIVENKKATIVANADSATGDGYCIIHGIARKIKL